MATQSASPFAAALLTQSAGHLTLALGVLIGLGLAGLFVLVWRARLRTERELSGRLPEGVAEILSALEDASCVLDGSGIVVAASDLAGEYRIELGGMLPSERLRNLVRAARDSGEPAALTLRVKTDDGDEVLVAARANRISSRFTVLMLRDVSEAERLDQMRTDFIANTGHELKTPIGAITLLAEAVDSAAEDADQVRHFTMRIQAEAQRLAQLSTRIMNLSHLQSADALNGATQLTVAQIIERAIEPYETQAESAGVMLVRGDIINAQVRGDIDILADAVGNLVTNAISYSPVDSRVVVATKRVADTVEILVADQGIGISDADRERIFERFYRADDARSRATGGSGLGLSIVKHAVTRHGGNVRVWSAPGKGSTFTISLPLSDAAAASAKSKQAKPKQGKKKPGKKKSDKQKSKAKKEATR